MEDSPIDYAFVLADLKAKRVQLDGAIAAIEAMLGPTASASLPATPGATSTDEDTGHGAFFALSIADAMVNPSKQDGMAPEGSTETATPNPRAPVEADDDPEDAGHHSDDPSNAP